MNMKAPNGKALLDLKRRFWLPLVFASAFCAICAPHSLAQGAQKADTSKPAPAGQDKVAKPDGAKADASGPFFAQGIVPMLNIQISEPEMQRLRDKNREYVTCTVVEAGVAQYEKVGIHLKGGAGSFRGVDDRPALTLKFDKYKKDQSFHDLDKIHLNNSVQDPGYMNELICSEIFLANGIPAARVTHARVKLNGRDLGMYVLKEGFDKKFLKHNGLDPKGNLYEGGFVQDLDGNPKLQNGDGPTDLSDVRAVVAACREPDAPKRWQRMDKLIDIDKFMTFMGLEMMTCHWDGYCNNRNNYRFYFDPKTGKVQFIPHGMDQMFGDTNFSVLNIPNTIVSNAIMTNPEWRTKYRDRITALLSNFVPADNLVNRVEAIHKRLRPVFAAWEPGKATEFDNQVKGMQDRLRARARALVQQNGVVESRALQFGPNGVARLGRWEARQESGDPKMELVDGMDGVVKLNLLSITADPTQKSVGSWRTKVILTAGKYRFEGRARVRSVRAAVDPSGSGAGIRISGANRTNKLDGTTTWNPLVHEFEITAPTQEVELILELRATSGQVLFDRASLKLVRLTGQ
jgi:hypothetical protein